MPDDTIVTLDRGQDVGRAQTQTMVSTQQRLKVTSVNDRGFGATPDLSRQFKYYTETDHEASACNEVTTPLVEQ
ncbi:hypothetical protein M404DRAFT_35320 [Pisolithus tinctorius Marx 270]|uniref:Uncharacterized protein n=1 Tax=Pisolithus tinctorius Marx 270 TaxID=870435 RepID=A0A0C3J8Z7_PISTI|nr:hypothetical protein M404DRAFT_35320 [Pisolithus tinctorius Marx 270]